MIIEIIKIKEHDVHKEVEYADTFFVVGYEKLSQKNEFQVRVFFDL